MSINIIFHVFSGACYVKTLQNGNCCLLCIENHHFFLLSDALNFKCQDSLYKNDFNTFSSRFCQVTYFSMPTDVKFIYSEKATKFCEIFTLLLSLCSASQSEDFAKFCGLLRIYELYLEKTVYSAKQLPNWNFSFSENPIFQALKITLQKQFRLKYVAPCRPNVAHSFG